MKANKEELKAKISSLTDSMKAIASDYNEEAMKVIRFAGQVKTYMEDNDYSDSDITAVNKAMDDLLATIRNKPAQELMQICKSKLDK